MISRVGLARLSMAVAFLGCGGPTDDASPGAGDPQRDLAAALAKAQCGNIGECCAAKNYIYDESACVALAGPVYELILPASDKAAYDMTKAGACVDAHAAAAATCQEPHGLPAECKAVYSGSVPEGGACRLVGECAAAPDHFAECVINASATAAACRTTSIGKVGDACSRTCQRLASLNCTSTNKGEAAACFTSEGLYCHAVTATCTPLSKVGEPCGSSTECEAGQFCSQSKCATPLALGAPCSIGTRCDGGYCDMKASAPTCKPLAALGELCTAHDACVPGAECYSPDSPLGGKCVDADQGVSATLCTGRP